MININHITLYNLFFFRAIFQCTNCKRKIRFTIRFKEYYDRVDIKSSTVPFIEKHYPTYLFCLIYRYFFRFNPNKKALPKKCFLW